MNIDEIRNFVKKNKGVGSWSFYPWEQYKKTQKWRFQFPPGYFPGMVDLSTDLLPFFDNLKMKDGYVLDYILRVMNPGDDPYVYSRKTDSKPLEQLSHDKMKENEYLNDVIFSSDAKGYMELAILFESCRQFYLYWHAQYRNFTFLFNQKHVEELIEDQEKEEYVYRSKFTKEFIDQIRTMDFSPFAQEGEVIMKGFRLHGGIVERTYVIPEINPSKITYSDKEILGYGPGYYY